MSAEVLAAGLAHGRRVAAAADQAGHDMVTGMVLDTIGCVVGAGRSRMGEVLTRRIAATPGGDVAVAGLGLRTDLPTAVAAEVTLVHVEEFDMFHGASAICPAGVTVVPALIAGAAQGASGAAVLRAVQVGAEALLDVAVGLSGPQLYGRRFWPSAALGALGAAVTVGEILGLDEERIVAAMAIAAAQAGGLLSLQDRFEAHYLLYGRAAWVGYEAALLAAAGARGDRGVLDSAAGAAFGVEVAVAERPAHLPAAVVKPYPVARPLHAAIEAIMLLQVEHALGAQDIASVEVAVPTATAAILNTARAPRSTDEAVCSVPYVLAAALAGVADRPATYRDTGLSGVPVALSATLTGAADLDAQYPAQWGAMVTVHLHDGRALTQHVADGLGGPVRPLPPVDLIRKFEAQVGPVLGAHAAETCVRLVGQLDELPSVDALRHVITGAAPAVARSRSHT